MRNLVFLAALAALSATSFAQVSLTPGTSVVPPSTLPFSGIPTGATGLVSMTDTFTGLDDAGMTVFTGSLTTSVSRLANNTLAFAYYFSNNSGSMDAIERLNVSSFAGFTTSVGQSGTAGFVAASNASRTSNGRTVSFDFGVGTANGPVPAGQATQTLYVFTNATQYTTGVASLIDGGVGTAAAYVPQAVPEPASIAALGLGVVGLARRRRKA